MKLTLWILAIALGIAVVTGGLLGRRQDHAISEALGDQERRIAELRNQLIALAQSEELDRRVAPRLMALVSGSTDNAATPPATATAGPFTSDAGISAAAIEAKTPEMAMAEAHERLEIAFTEDRLDPEWASTAQRIANSKLPEVLPKGSAIRSVECRSSICRLETSHRDREAYWAFLHAAIMNSNVLWNAATYSTPLNDDPNENFMVTYIAREGHLLPQMAE